MLRPGNEGQQTKLTPSLRSHLLIGDEQENFYQLGLADRAGYFSLKKHLNQLIHRFPKTAGKICPFNRYKSWMSSYAEGLGEKSEDFYRTISIPEYLTSQQKSESFMTLGCSSFFHHNSKTTFHGRVLDTPLLETYSKHERELIFQFQNYAKVWTLGAQGFPLASFHGQNEYGLSLALHSKFSDRFFPFGTHIFEIITHVLLEADTLDSAIKILRRYRSRVKWGLYLAKDDQVCELDIFKDQLEKRVFTLKPGDSLYFNNKDITASSGQPAGNQNFNDKREKNFLRSLAKHRKKTDLDQKEILELLGSPFSEEKEPFSFSALTSSSVQISCLDLGAKTVALIEGGLPRIFEDKYLLCSDLFSSKEQKWQMKKSRKKKRGPRQIAGHRHLSLAQNSIDLNDLPYAFYHLQMAMAYFEASPAHYYALFFFYFLKSTHLTCPKELSLTLVGWKRNLQNFEPYLRDHAYLFIARLETELGHCSSVRYEYIKSPKLQYIFLKERKLSVSKLKRLKTLRRARIDISDVIHLY